MFYNPFGYYHSTQTSTHSRSLTSSSSSTTISAQFQPKNLNNLPNHLMNNLEFHKFNPFYNQFQNGYQSHSQNPYFSTKNAEFYDHNLHNNKPFNDEFQQHFFPKGYQTNSDNIWTPLNVQTKTSSNELNFTKIENTSQRKSTSESSSTKTESYYSPTSTSALSPRAIIKIHNPFSINQDDYAKPNLKPNFTRIKSDENTEENKYFKSKKIDKQNKNSNNLTRNLPTRSQNIDMSNYLKYKTQDSPMMSPLSNSISPNSSVSGPVSPFSLNANKSSTFKPIMECSFCKTNGEKKEIYSSHNLKDSLGKLLCPILREFKCPKCGESGDYAHTNKYCPVTQRKKKENKIKKLSLID